jgi:hypothetical protein
MGKRNRTRKQKPQAKALFEFLAEQNKQEERVNENNVPALNRLDPRFFNVYGEPLNRSSLENIEWRQNWRARLNRNNPRHVKGTPANQRRKLALHREQLFPALQNVHSIGKRMRQINKTQKAKKALVENISLLPPIPEMGFPGGNEYRKALERFETSQRV